MDYRIKTASKNDFSRLYEIGLKTPELKVSKKEVFMGKDEFLLKLEDNKHIFFISEYGKKAVGFICINLKDIDRPLKHKYAGLVYMAVLSPYRKNGIATQLYSHSVKELKKLGITHMYTWANEKSASIQKFLKKNGFALGNKFYWTSRRL